MKLVIENKQQIPNSKNVFIFTEIIIKWKAQHNMM